MTAQISERLLYEGESVALMSNPLETYFAMRGERPAFEANFTALWRGYVGRWEILDDRLYLVGLSGTLEGGAEVTLETVFPGFADRVFAHWFSGVLRIPRGQRLKHVRMGYGSVHERDVLIDMHQGRVVGTETRINGVAPPQAPQPVVVAGVTLWPRRPHDVGGDA